MNPKIPWWLVSLLWALGAVGVVALACVLPNRLGILLGLGIVVFLYIYMRNPAYRYSRMAWAVFGAWIAAHSMPSLTLALSLRAYTFGHFMLENSSGPVFDLACALVFFTLLILDYKSRAGTSGTKELRSLLSNSTNPRHQTAHGNHPIQTQIGDIQNSKVTINVGQGSTQKEHSQGPRDERELRLERLQELESGSRARCVARFIAAGARREDALIFADDGSLGSPHEKLRPDAAIPLKLIVGDLGLGKTLIAERLHQAAIETYKQDGRQLSPIPVFLEAEAVTGSLRASVESACEGLGVFRSRGATIVLDGLDQAGVPRASKLLNEGRILVESVPGTTLTITSRPLLELFRAQERISVEPLSLEECAKLVSRIAGRPIDLYPFPESVRDAIRLPLFAIMLGAILKDGKGLRVHSRGELIADLVENAIRGLSGDHRKAMDILKGLAVKSIDRSAGAIPISEIGTAADVDFILNSGLVAKSGTAVSFPLPILTQWFAAQSLADGKPCAKELLQDPNRLERWRYALVIFISIFDFDRVTVLLSPLVEHNVGYGALLCKEGLTRDFHVETAPPVTSECVRQLRIAMAAWSKGAEKISALIAPVSESGDLQELGVRQNADGTITTAWAIHPPMFDKVCLPSLPEPHHFVGESSGYRIAKGFHGHQSAWAWLWTLETLKYGLSKALGDAYIFTDDIPLRLESAWSVAVDLAKANPLRTASIPLETIQRALPTQVGDLLNFEASRPWISIRQVGLVHLVLELDKARRAGQEELLAPWPVTDLSPTGGMYWDLYSRDQLLNRIRSILRCAILSYEWLSKGWLSGFSRRLRTAVMFPARLDGFLIESTNETAPGSRFLLDWYMTPLPNGSESTVNIRFAPEDLAKSGQDRFEAIQAALLEHRKGAAEWASPLIQTEILSYRMLNCDAPIRHLVYEWIKNDLRLCNLA